MSTAEVSGSFMGLRGENCSFTFIDGVERLSTRKGVDLVHIAEGLHSQLAKFKELFDDLSDRMDRLESFGVTKSTNPVDSSRGASSDEVEELEQLVEQLKLRIETLEKLPKAKNGRDGRDGTNGEDGRDGRPGKDAKEFNLGDLKDVDTTGIVDRALLEWSEAKKCFVVSVE